MKYEILEPREFGNGWIAIVKYAVRYHLYAGRGSTQLAAVVSAAHNLWKAGHKVRLPIGYEFANPLQKEGLKEIIKVPTT